MIELTDSSSKLRYVPLAVSTSTIQDTLHRIPAIDTIAAAVGWRPECGLDAIREDVIAERRGDQAASAASA